jgi:alpha-mannosidase
MSIRESTSSAAGESGADNRDLHMIGNAHMDPVWIWNWREGFGEVWATFGSALDRLEEYPDVIFTASSAAYYAWIEAHDPTMFTRIKDAVRDGRWCVVGGMWIEPDCNIPSGESICRQLLLGQRYFHQTFGRVARVGYNIDSFGHAAGIPTLLGRAGLRSYVMMRPGEHEKELPAYAFQWTDASGQGVPTYRIPFNYETDTTEVMSEKIERTFTIADRERTPQMCFFGIGNHGGGPTRAMLDAIDVLRVDEPRVRYSDPARYFDELRSVSELPVVMGELQHHAVGCYSASGWVKTANRTGESALLNAEVLEAVASRLVGRTSRVQELRGAWEQLALGQFHDILAGTASEAAYRTVRDRYGYVNTVADEVTTNAIYEIAHRVDTRVATVGAWERESIWSRSDDAATPFFVYNPLAWSVRQTVVAAHHATRVLDSTGREVVFQPVASGEATVYRTHSLFEVELDAFGYEVYWLQGYPEGEGEGEGGDGDATAVPASFERGRFRVVVDESSGSIVSLFDLETDTELVEASGIRPSVQVDESDTWSHDLVRYDGASVAVEFLSCELIEDGPVRTVLRLRYSAEASTLYMDVVVNDSDRHVEFRMDVQWTNAHRVVKLVLPWRLHEPSTVAGAAYSFQERRPNGDEEVFQGWLDHYDERDDRGIGLTSDHLYGYDALDSVTRVTLLRNPLSADHGRGWATRIGEDFPLTDSERQQFTIRVHPHRGDWRHAELWRLADEHHRPPLVVADTYHDGPLAAHGAFICIDPESHGCIRAVKRSESDQGVVLRLVEPGGRPRSFTIRGELLGRDVRVDLKPFEVQTLLVPDADDSPVRVVDVTELEESDVEGDRAWA